MRYAIVNGVVLSRNETRDTQVSDSVSLKADTN